MHSEIRKKIVNRQSISICLRECYLLNKSFLFLFSILEYLKCVEKAFSTVRRNAEYRNSSQLKASAKRLKNRYREPLGTQLNTYSENLLGSNWTLLFLSIYFWYDILNILKHFWRGDRNISM